MHSMNIFQRSMLEDGRDEWPSIFPRTFLVRFESRARRLVKATRTRGQHQQSF